MSKPFAMLFLPSQRRRRRTAARPAAPTGRGDALGAWGRPWEPPQWGRVDPAQGEHCPTAPGQAAPGAGSYRANAMNEPREALAHFIYRHLIFKFLAPGILGKRLTFVVAASTMGPKTKWLAGDRETF